MNRSRRIFVSRRSRLGLPVCACRHRRMSSESTVGDWMRARNQATKQKPSVVFPWRHEESFLRRLDPSLEEENGGVFGPCVPVVPWHMKVILNHLAAYQMQVPVYQLPFRGWQTDLAESSKWAFSQAIAAVLSRSYNGESSHCRIDTLQDLTITACLVQSNLQFPLRAFSETTTPSL